MFVSKKRGLQSHVIIVSNTVQCSPNARLGDRQEIMV